MFAQQSGTVNTGLEGPVKYKATDSIVASIETQKVRLYGDSYVEYEGITMQAERIEIDIQNNEVIATYGLDSTGTPIGKPLFTGEGEETSADYIKYNFETQQGYIREVRTEQEGGYLHMEEAKIHPNEEIHLHHGKFTTCDLDTPHFHFKMTKAVIVPNERIVTGPIYMKIFNIPTPLAAPFAFLPNNDSKKHGFIIPFPTLPDERAGFGLTNGGYYFPINDNIDTRFIGSVFTTGMFSAENTTTYNKRYKFNGSTLVRYEYIRGRFHDTTQLSKWTVRWNHRQDAKAHPSLSFTSDINFQSDNNAKVSLQPVNSQYFNNQFNSSMNVVKNWTAGNFRGNMTLKTSLQQNSSLGQYNLELPAYNLTVSRFNLSDFQKNKIGTNKVLDNIQVSYRMDASNNVIAADSVFRGDVFGTIADNAKNGVKHNAIVQSNLRFFGGRVLFNPTITYNEIWNFQHETRSVNEDTYDIDTVFNRGFRSSRNLQFSGGLTQNFYGYYRFKGEKKTRFKHDLNILIRGTYKPDISIWEEVSNDSITDFFYSPFANSRYADGSRGESASINFSLANTLAMKKKDLNDTINESTITRKLVDRFNITGSYDFLRDSMKLSDIQFSLQTARFLNVFNFTSNATLSPYGHDESTGADISDYAWQNNQGLGRFVSADAAVTANFTNQNGRSKQKELDQNTDGNVTTNQLVTDNNYIDFDIPWKLNLSYNIRYTQASISNGTSVVDSFNLIQTIRADGDFNLGEKWKFTYLFNFDLQAEAANEYLTNYQFSVWRDLHCWEAQLTFGQLGPWVPNVGLAGQNLTFLFRINVKASMFSDIKLELNQPPFFW